MSHPADTVVSKLNNDVGSTPIQAARELGMKGEYYLLVKRVSQKLIEITRDCYTLQESLEIGNCLMSQSSGLIVG